VCVVEKCAAKLGPESIYTDTLDHLVDAATHAPPDGPGSTALGQNEGQNLLQRVDNLFVRIILPYVSSPRIFRACARGYSYRRGMCPEC
jgi:hypothetical protein